MANYVGIGFCDYDLQEDTPHGTYNWPETEVNQNSTLECAFGPDKEGGMATRQCSGLRQWSGAAECVTENTFRLRELANVSSLQLCNMQKSYNIITTKQ